MTASSTGKLWGWGDGHGTDFQTLMFFIFIGKKKNTRTARAYLYYPLLYEVQQEKEQHNYHAVNLQKTAKYKNHKPVHKRIKKLNTISRNTEF